MEKQRWEESEKRKNQKREDPGLRKVKKSRNTVLSAEPSGEMRDEQSHAIVARSTFPSQNAKNMSCSDHFWTFGTRQLQLQQRVLKLSPGNSAEILGNSSEISGDSADIFSDFIVRLYPSMT